MTDDLIFYFLGAVGLVIFSAGYLVGNLVEVRYQHRLKANAPPLQPGKGIDIDKLSPAERTKLFEEQRPW